MVFDTNGAVDAGGAIANIIGATYEIPDDTLFEFNYLLYDSEVSHRMENVDPSKIFKVPCFLRRPSISSLHAWP